MKPFKRLLIVIFSIIVLLTLISFFLPSMVKVQRTIEINTTSEIVFEQISDFHNWDKWSVWNRLDTAMQKKYYGAESGEGAGYEWMSKKTGDGSMMITASAPEDSLLIDLEFAGRGKAQIIFLMKKKDKNVFVSWTMKYNLGWNPLARYMSLMMDKWIGKDFEDGLSNLKMVSESIPKKINVKIELSRLEKFNYIGIREKCRPEVISEKLSAILINLTDYLKKLNIQQSNAPFAIYFSMNEDSVDIEGGIPVDEKIKSTERIKYYTINETKAVVGDYFGPYNSLAKAHVVIQKWITANNLVSSGAPIEMYITDAEAEKDSMKWLTRIYYPVK